MMKPINRLIVPLFVLMMILPVASCIIQGKIDLVVPYTFSDTFPVTEPDGVWDESIVVTYDDVMGDVDVSEANVSRVDIEAIGFTTEGASAALQGVKNLTLSISSPSLPSGPLMIIENESIDRGAGKDTVYVTDLVEQGVIALKDKFEGFVLGRETQSFTLRTTGSSNPDGTSLNMDLNVVIKVAVVTVEDLE